MFDSHKYKKDKKEGIVIVSISNLFHILDISRTKEKDDSQFHKSNTRSVFFLEQSMLKDKDKEKDGQIKRQQTVYNETENDIRSKSKELDNKIEDNKESKDNLTEKDIKVKKSKENKEIKDSKEGKDNNTEKGVKFKDQKNLSNATTLKKNLNRNKTIKKKKTSCCDYFFNLALCNFILLVVNNSFLWIFNYMFSDQKNKSYCYRQNVKEFGICIYSDFCPSEGNHDFIYVNDDAISDTDLKIEINNINKKYLDFYIHEAKIFSFLNKKFLKTETTLSKYKITIISTKNENYLFNNTFRVGCERYFMGVLAIIILSFFGNLIFGLLADIWGRKKILIITIFIEIAGGYVLFTSTFYISYLTDNNAVKEKINNDFLSDFLLNINDNTQFTDDYKSVFSDIKNEVYETRIIKDRFQRYKLLVFLGLFLIFLANSSVKTITLSYLLENALTEEDMSLYYLLFIFSIPLSIFLSTIMVIYTNSFHYAIIILTSILIIINIIIIIFFYESQRFNFEYCYYSRITEFTEYILGKEELKNNYKVKDEDLKNNADMSTTLEKENMNFFGIYYSFDDYRIQTELNNERINESTGYLDTLKYPKSYFYNNLFYKKKIQKINSKNIIERFNIFRNPFYFVKLINKDKQIRKKSAVILSFIISISIVINLTLQRITTNYLVQRDKLISQTIFRTYLFSYIIICFIILFPFVHYLVKCFGLYIILFPSLVLITFSTGFFELICFMNSDGGVTDLTKYVDGDNEKLIDYSNSYLLPFVYILSFCFVCLDYVLYFFIIKLTKTIYRCSFLGNCQIIYNFCFLIGSGLEKYISGGYYYAFIFSIISIVNSIFINSSEDSLNISEMREIKFDETKSNEK